MEATKITPKQIYVTRIRKKKREIEPDHWITETFSNVPAPTGDAEMDRVARLLAERDNVTLQELAYLHPEDVLFCIVFHVSLHSFPAVSCPAYLLGPIIPFLRVFVQPTSRLTEQALPFKL